MHELYCDRLISCVISLLQQPVRLIRRVQMAVGSVGAGVKNGKKRVATVAHTADAVYLLREVSVYTSFVLNNVDHCLILASSSIVSIYTENVQCHSYVVHWHHQEY